MSSVNFLEKLLDGVEVEWLSLGNLAEIYGGLTGKSKSDFEQGNANYITYKNIFSYIEINPDVFEKVKISPSEKQHKVQYGDILFTGSSEIANEAGISSAVTTKFDEEVYLNSFSFGVRFKSNANITPEFAKYLFRCSFMRLEISKTASGVTRFNISKERFKKILIPVLCPENPKKSLEIQAEIVRILDAMTAHTAELTAELTARKKQYNYYRDKLLSFEDDVNELPLSDICTSIADGDHQAPPQTNKGISFVTISNISDNGFIDFLKTKYVPNDYYNNLASKRKPQVGDVLYTVVGSIGIPVFIDFEKEFTFQRHIAILRFKPELVNPKYAFHFMRSSKFFNKANSVAMGAAQKTITLGTLGKLKISLPSLDRQNKVVAILDKFDSLANSITEGLPREIELRQKQYAYYRDLLLSFPQVQAA